MAALSDRRRRIIGPVLADPRRFVLLSVRDLAKELSTDAATVVRIVRGMGFENYREFQRHLHELSIAFATSLETMRENQARIGRGGALVCHCCEQDLKNLAALRNSLDPGAIISLARRLHAARRVFIFGGDAAAPLVAYLEYNLTLLGLPVFAGSSPGRIVHLAQSARKTDLAIAISFQRGLRMTIEGLKQARAKGVYCAGICDTLLSPVARFADVMFLASVEAPTFTVSYVAPMALLNGLIAACGDVRRSRTLALLRDVDEEQRHGSRWYADDLED